MKQRTLQIKRFNELEVRELYDILKVRAEIFVVEQEIVYQDLDGIDLDALHFILKENGVIIGYLRAFWSEDRQAVKIGRVLSRPHGQGIGRLLMEKSLPEIVRCFHTDRLVMDAQLYAVPFYEKLGFSVTTVPFMEEGILHVGMERKTDQD